ncbi:nSTAND1 domain-containing NTPase, partial [Streptomyces sp. SP18BB07]|uniref:nSTAND1 domain-containing NTPase n=1 Tax=Streptomyces sp. SP18BB07 TaxID=3002522 RepID=UPI002E75A785
YVKACGGDPGEWEVYWKEAEAAVAAVSAGDEEDAPAPYGGRARIDPDDQMLFFGRDRLVAELCVLMTAHSFAAVFGASGSGKSSLLRAGVVPRVREAIARREG